MTRMLKGIKILHVIDDNKFIRYCEETFNINRVTNVYLNSEAFNDEVRDKEFNLIVLHYLNLTKAKVINKNLGIPIIWFFWGNDGFLLGKFSMTFLQIKTKRLYLKLGFEKSLNEGVRRIIKSTFPEISDCLSYNKEIIKSFSKINFIVPVMPGDYNLLKTKYTIKAPMFHLNYVNPSFKEDQTHLKYVGDSILLGNSASYSNNHIEVLDILEKQNLNGQKVIIPLSYGDHQYAKYVEKYAKNILKDKVSCLMSFLPIDEYTKILNKCGIVIMNHKRQQALGNIVILLAQGSHVYFNEESSLYVYLSQNKFHISKINDQKEFKILSPAERQENRKLCLLFFGRKRQNRRIEELIENTLNLTLNDN